MTGNYFVEGCFVKNKFRVICHDFSLLNVIYWKNDVLTWVTIYCKNLSLKTRIIFNITLKLYFKKIYVTLF